MARKQTCGFNRLKGEITLKLGFVNQIGLVANVPSCNVFKTMAQ